MAHFYVSRLTDIEEIWKPSDLVSLKQWSGGQESKTLSEKRPFMVLKNHFTDLRSNQTTHLTLTLQTKLFGHFPDVTIRGPRPKWIRHNQRQYSSQ